MNKNKLTKKAKLNLVGVNGNAFAILGAFSNAAKNSGFSKAEIDAVVNEATSGDYKHLLATIMDHVEDP